MTIHLKNIIGELFFWKKFIFDILNNINNIIIYQIIHKYKPYFF